MTTTKKSNIISQKRTNNKKLISQGTQTDPEITQQAFTQAAISEQLFLMLNRQKEDSNLMRNLFLHKRSKTNKCTMSGCKRKARSNNYKYCEPHFNETFTCNITTCTAKRVGSKDFCFRHVEQSEIFKNQNKPVCNVEACNNVARRRGVCKKHFDE